LRQELPFPRKQRRLTLAAAIAAAPLMFAPAAVSAENLLDFFFGGPQKTRQNRAPSLANFFADPFGLNPQPAPAPRPAVASTGPAFCVRSCDGKYFPLTRGSPSPAQMCQAFCPASPTRVFFGSNIDSAYASNGERYADSENAFVYRTELRADCTCNGRNPAGLAPIDIALDASLRPGDVVATTDGPLAYSSVRRKQPDRGIHADRVLPRTDRRRPRAAERNEGRPRSGRHGPKRRVAFGSDVEYRADRHDAEDADAGQARRGKLTVASPSDNYADHVRRSEIFFLDRGTRESPSFPA
jgi:hypothetical protein